MSFLSPEKAFGRLTSIPRKIGVLPESFKTPQGAIDTIRGKEKKDKKKKAAVLTTDNEARGSTLTS